MYALGEVLRGFRISQTSDGGFVIGGEGFEEGQSKPNVRALRISADKNILYVSSDDSPYVQTAGTPLQLVLGHPDGGAVIAGLSESNTMASSRLRMIRLDSDGHPVWDVQLGDILLIPASVFHVPDIGFGVVGVASLNDSPTAGFLFVISPNGDVLFYREFPDAIALFSHGFADASDSIQVFGATGLPNPANPGSNTLCWTVNAEEETDTYKLFDFGHSELVRSLAPHPTGGFVLSVSDAGIPLIVRLDSTFQIDWIQTDFLDGTVGNESENAWDLAVTPDGLIGVTGTERRVDYIAQTIPVIREASFVALLDASGERLWKTNIAGTNLYGIAHTAQDTFVATGVTSGGNLHVVEIDMNGNVL